MANVSGAANYRFVDSSKLGLSGGPVAPPLFSTQWAPGTVYPAKAQVVNGGFLFATAAGGTSAAAVAVGPQPGDLTDNTVTWTLSGAYAGPYLVTTTQQHELGIICELLDAGPNAFGLGEAVYCKYSGTTVPGDFVVIDRYNFTGIQSNTTQRGLVGVGLGVGAAGSFGWVLVRGVHDHANLGNGASVVGQIPYMSATAGRVLTTVSGTNGLPGCIIKVTGTAANYGAVEMAWAVAAGNP